jgi:hypothetical protein
MNIAGVKGSIVLYVDRIGFCAEELERLALRKRCVPCRIWNAGPSAWKDDNTEDDQLRGAESMDKPTRRLVRSYCGPTFVTNGHNDNLAYPAGIESKVYNTFQETTRTAIANLTAGVVDSVHAQ